MAENAASSGVDRQLLLDKHSQLLGDIRIHAKMARPLGIRRIDIKTGARAEIIACVLALNAGLARTRVGRDQNHSVLSGQALDLRLGHEDLFIARESREPVQHRKLSPE